MKNTKTIATPKNKNVVPVETPKTETSNNRSYKYNFEQSNNFIDTKRNNAFRVRNNVLASHDIMQSNKKSVKNFKNLALPKNYGDVIITEKQQKSLQGVITKSCKTYLVEQYANKVSRFDVEQMLKTQNDTFKRTHTEFYTSDLKIKKLSDVQIDEIKTIALEQTLESIKVNFKNKVKK